MSLSPIEDVKFNRYFFEYRHDNADWGIEIVARSSEEAKQRIQALTWARYQGEIKAIVPVPATRLIEKMFAWFR